MTSARLYPIVPSSEEPDQRFRLARIAELDAFIASEVEDRRRLQKKYQRAVNIIQGLSTGVGVARLGLETAGLALIGTGIAALPGIILSALGAGAFVVDLVCTVIGRKLSAKSQKHGAVMQIAQTKLNTIHQHVSAALNEFSEEEFKLIADEMERYQAMKEEIRSKTRSVADDAAKNEWMERGREEVRAQFAKHLGVTSLPK